MAVETFNVTQGSGSKVGVKVIDTDKNIPYYSESPLKSIETLINISQSTIAGTSGSWTSSGATGIANATVITILNDTDCNLQISFNGTNPHRIVPAGTFRSFPNLDGATQIHYRYIGSAPTVGTGLHLEVER